MTAANPLHRFKVLTFDVVGTLIDFERGMLDYLRSSGAAPASISDNAILDVYRAARGMPKAALFPDDLERCYGELVRQLGLKDDGKLARGFRDSAEHWPGFADSKEALARLAKRYRLVAMTNAQRWALDHFSRTLGNPFWDTVCVDDALTEKPDPVFFGFARGRISRSGFTRDDILHVAQSQYHDIGIARQLGYTTCWIERRKGLGAGGTIKAASITKPDYHFTALAELADAAG